MNRGKATQRVARAVKRGDAKGKAEFILEVASPVSPRPASAKARAPVPRRRSQEERRTEAESRLLDAALNLLARKGWVGMTLAEVGEDAGYSRGHASHHFGNKGMLLRALVSHMYGSFAGEMQAAQPMTPGLQSVLGYVRVYFARSDVLWTNTRALLVLLAEALLEDSDTAEVVAECSSKNFTWLEENLRIGIAQGEVRADVDPTLGAEFVIGAVRGVAQQRLLRGRVANIRRNREQVVRLIEQALAAPAGRDSVKSKR